MDHKDNLEPLAYIHDLVERPGCFRFHSACRLADPLFHSLHNPQTKSFDRGYGYRRPKRKRLS